MAFISTLAERRLLSGCSPERAHVLCFQVRFGVDLEVWGVRGIIFLYLLAMSLCGLCGLVKP
ncbi:hypothetical protein B0H12DRAFT_1123508 [Mycena haematopus]|nr:hypothetical protein B0H12DRAFT_1123508 [Mycena haematopus]